ncbi:MAG: phage portal protein [Chloroflexota bacterium]
MPGKDLLSLLAPRRTVAGPVNRAPVPYVGRQGATTGGGMWLGGGRGRGDDLAAMGENGTLYGIISRLADAVSSIEWHMEDPSPGTKCEVCGEVGWAAVADPDPMLMLWLKPNPHFYGALFRETSQQHVDLTGEWYWVIVTTLGIPTEMWPVRPDRMTPVPDQRDYLIGWVYTGPDGERVPLLPEQVIQGRTPDPENMYRGIGPLGALAPTLAGARLSAEWLAKFYENNALPGGIVEFEEAMDDTQYRTFVDRWREAHQGINNAHRVGIIEMGKWVETKFTQRDMQFAEGQTLTASQIREAYGFPEFAQGIVKDLNRATAEASDDFFAAWLAVPRARRIRDVLNHRLVPLFGTMAAVGRRFAFKSPVEGDVEAKAKVVGLQATAFATLVNAGVPAVEAAGAVGLPAMGLEEISTGAAIASPREIAEMVQKIYLGVDTVLTWEEAREVLVAAGADLDLSITQPKPDPAPIPGSLERQKALPAGPADRAKGWLSRVINGDGWIVNEVPDYVERVGDDWTRALDALVGDWTADVQPELDRALLAGVESALAAGDPVRLAVLDMSADMSQGVTLVEQAMRGLALRAATRVAEEAAAHGVDVAPIAPHNSAVPGIMNISADMGTVAAATVALLVSGYGQAVGAEALRWVGSGRTVDEIKDKVKAFMRGLSPTGLRARFGGLLTRAQNGGRIATLAMAPVERWFANERLDGSTCEPCKKISGKRLPTVEAMILAYGGGGGYLFCEGRERCRGFPDAEWTTESGE